MMKKPPPQEACNHCTTDFGKVHLYKCTTGHALLSKMASRSVSRSTISLPVPGLVASLKSGKSDSDHCALAAASGAIIFLLV